MILRKREPMMERPLRIGGAGNFGKVIGVTSVIFCAGLISLYLPGMPAAIGIQPWLLFGAWWAMGFAFLVRVPRGIEPGINAEDELLARLAMRRAAKGRATPAHAPQVAAPDNNVKESERA